MERPYHPKAIANWFLGRAEKEGQRLDPMKVQKLTYLAHGWHLGLHGEPLINEEVQAWQYGPVINSLYHEFKSFGAGEITGRATSWDFSSQGEPALVEPVVDPSDVDTIALLERVWDVYGSCSAVELSAMTHQPGSPWSQTWQEMTPKLRGKGIPNSRIKEGFETLIRERNG